MRIYRNQKQSKELKSKLRERALKGVAGCGLAWYGTPSPYMLRPEALPKATNRTWRYRTDFAKQFNGHMDRLSLGHVTFHDLRRTFASLHVSHGTPIYHVAKWLGDEIAVVESTYGHLLPSDSRINDPWTHARGGAA